LISPTVRLALTTGFLGGLTTYSSFNLEMTRLLGDRAWSAGIANVLVTTIGCFLAGPLGATIARRLG
jgi:CrcB protein